MSPRPLRIAIVALCLVWLPAGSAYAQDTLGKLIGRPIAAVELQTEGRPESSPALLALIDIKPGDRFAIDAMRRVEDRLSQVPRFESVSVLADERPDGLVLIFSLVPRHPVDRLDFQDDTGLPARELDRLVREQFGGLPALARLRDVEGAVVRILQSEGFRSATVSSEVVQFHDPDRATLVVHVRAGTRTTIGRIDVNNQSRLSRDDVLKRLGIAPGAPYRDRALDAELADLADELRRQGFYKAVAYYQPPPREDTEVDLIITVSAGPLVRLMFEGDLPGDVDDFIPIKRLGSVDQDLLDDSRLATEKELRRQGYWRALVTYQLSETPDALLITFTIDRGKRFRIERIEMPAGLQISAAEISAQPALKLGEWFSEEAVTRALLAVKAAYQQLGFYEVTLDPKYQATPGRSEAEGGVIIAPNITEGRRASVSAIVFDLDERPAVPEVALRQQMRATERGPYVPANLIFDREALQLHYESQGYLNHDVTIRPECNDAGTEVTLRVRAREGARVVVGEITVVGTERYSRDWILRQITLRVGEPYSEAARVESQNRLNRLSTFRSARVRAEPRLPGESEARIVVSVEEASRFTVGFGGGVEAGTTPRAVEGGGTEDRLEFSPRASIDVGRRNLGGRNRAINLFARLSLKPRNAPNDPERDGQGFGFTEYRVNATYRERYAFNSDSEVLLGLSSEQAVRTTFSYLRRGANADVLHPVSANLSVSGRYAFEVTRLFDERLNEAEQSLIDRLFPQVRLSILSGGGFWDRRDNRIATARGTQGSVGLDFAPRWLGSEVGFVKAIVQGSIFRPLVAPRRLILAVRGQLGLARGFERRVPVLDENGSPVLDSSGNPLVDVVADIPASHRFFAGGSTTVRGFQLDRLGAREILNEDGLSDGGNAMVVLNGELRFSAGELFGRNLTLVGFTDAGNVFDRIGDLSLRRLRATAGFGVRYDSPFGPVRLDIGFKLDRFTFAKGRERRWEFHLSLGEVF